MLNLPGRETLSYSFRVEEAITRAQWLLSFLLILPGLLLWTGPIGLSHGAKPGVMVVQVVDAWINAPLSNAEVSLPAHGWNTLTSAAGIAVLERPRPGEILLITHPGYLPLARVYAGEARLVVALRPQRISGRVIDANDGRPLPRAWVHVNDQWTRTDDRGSFSLPVEGEGGHLLVRAPGYARGRWSLGPSTSPPPWDAVFPLPEEANRTWLRPMVCAYPPCIEIALAPYPVRAFYIPLALLSRPDYIRHLLDMAAESPVINGVVIDVKGDTGKLAWESADPTAIAVKAYHNGQKWVSLGEFLSMSRKRGLYVIARMVIFKDAQLAAGKPDWAIQREDGTPWTDRKGTPWVDPFRREVWAYHIALAREVAALGVDEIQLDYVRFPSDGDLGAIQYDRENTLEARTTAIREFVSQFVASVRPLGVFIAADVFGLTVWVVPESDMLIGQRVMDIGPLVDYLSPMVYPSTFIPGNLGLDDPQAYPYEVVRRSTEQAISRLPSGVRVRPWLQAYGYSLAEMLIQRHAANDGGAAGWMFWNAGGVYDPHLFGSLPDLETLQKQIAEGRAAP